MRYAPCCSGASARLASTSERSVTAAPGTRRRATARSAGPSIPPPLSSSRLAGAGAVAVLPGAARSGSRTNAPPPGSAGVPAIRPATRTVSGPATIVPWSALSLPGLPRSAAAAAGEASTGTGWPGPGRGPVSTASWPRRSAGHGVLASTAG